MRLRIVACEIFFREVCHLAAASPQKVDVEFLPKGLHDQGGGPMRERLQSAVDATDPEHHDAVALAYGLCNNNARYLLETMTRHYRRLAFIRMGIEPDRAFESRARDLAAERGWEFEALEGDLDLLRRLVAGEWDDEDFLVLRPGERAAATLGPEILRRHR